MRTVKAASAEPTRAPTVREQLVAGAIMLIDTQGLLDLSVRRLATAGGRTTMCVYSKFGNRAGLLGAVYDRLASDLNDLLAAAADPVEELSAYSARHPQRYLLLIGTDPLLVGLDPAPRANLLEMVVSTLGHGDPLAGEAHFARVHGEAVLRLARQP